MTYLKKILISIFIMLCCFSTFAATQQKIEKTIKKVDQQFHYTISAKYPVYSSQSLQLLNDEINKQINNAIKSFRANIEVNPQAINDLPLNENSNTLTITYKTVSHTPRVISLLFTIDTFFYGAAHPNESFFSINFALSPPRLLTLQDIFQDNVIYLTFLEKYAEHALPKQLNKAANTKPGEAIAPYPEGIKPIPSNYEIWNITPRGLMLTFPPYQVAPYVFGAQHLIIPYNDMKTVQKQNLKLP